MDPLLRQFHRQYLQQVINLRYPPSKLLAHADIQRQIYRYFFNESAQQYLPPHEYQRKVLKRLVAEILKEVDNDDDEISDELMSHMGYLSSLPKQSDLETVQTLRVLSYFLPDPPSAVVTTSTFDNHDRAAEGGLDVTATQRVLIRESPRLMAAGSNVGLRTWEACLRLATYLCTSSARSTMRGANVFELGAGTGLLSLICSMHLGAGNVIATDGLEHVVEGIEENIDLNKRHAGEDMGFPVAKLLDWTDLGNLDDVLLVDGQKVDFDYILGADLTYNPELLDSIASLISKLKDRFPRTRVLISHTVRNENTLKLWRQTCLDYRLVTREVNEKEDGWVCPPYLMQTGLFHEQAFPTVIMDITVMP